MPSMTGENGHMVNFEKRREFAKVIDILSEYNQKGQYDIVRVIGLIYGLLTDWNLLLNMIGIG